MKKFFKSILLYFSLAIFGVISFFLGSKEKTIEIFTISQANSQGLPTADTQAQARLPIAESVSTSTLLATPDSSVATSVPATDVAKGTVPTSSAPAKSNPVKAAPKQTQAVTTKPAVTVPAPKPVATPAPAPAPVATAPIATQPAPTTKVS